MQHTIINGDTLLSVDRYMYEKSRFERHVATLTFLTTGGSYENLKYYVAISPQRLGNIIPDM